MYQIGASCACCKAPHAMRVKTPVPVRAPRCSALIDFGSPFPASGLLCVTQYASATVSRQEFLGKVDLGGYLLEPATSGIVVLCLDH